MVPMEVAILQRKALPLGNTTVSATADNRAAAADEVVTYLNQFGYFAKTARSWQELSSLRSQRPRLTIAFLDHKEVGKHTLYNFRCRLDSGQGVISWHTSKRLAHLRQGLLRRILALLGDDYPRVFSQAAFPHRGGLPGTSARLETWLAKLSQCVNDEILHPEQVAYIFAFLDAPAQERYLGELLTSPECLDDYCDDSPSLFVLERQPASLQSAQANIQALYYQELSKKFEYESAERCFGLQCRGVGGIKLLQDVLVCFSENLDDYSVRLEARSSVWDDAQRKVLPLDCFRRKQLQLDMFDRMQQALSCALIVAATAACERGPSGQSILTSRRYSLESEVEDLLAQKTFAVEAYEDLQEDLSLEDMSTCASEMLSIASSVTVSSTPRRKRKSALSWIKRS